MNKRIKLVVGGLVDDGYEELVVFIYIDDTYFGLLSQEKGVDNLIVEFFEKSKLKKIDYELFLEALIEAKKYLLNE
jgi:hypothetical protein